MLLRTLEARETTALFISALVSLRLDFLAFGYFQQFWSSPFQEPPVQRRARVSQPRLGGVAKR